VVRDGKRIYVGNFAGWDLAAAQETAKACHILGLVSEQSLYNLMERTMAFEVLLASRHYGIGLLTWSPVAGGLLAGAGAKAAAGRRGGDSVLLGHSARERRIADSLTNLQAYEALAPTWASAPPRSPSPGCCPDAAILGPRTLDQLNGSFPALDVLIDEEISGRLDKLLPGPGGEAPDAYTW
jgi:aryl-alcohol dehydrogenase-like predicted oxidoreductase